MLWGASFASLSFRQIVLSAAPSCRLPKELELVTTKISTSPLASMLDIISTVVRLLVPIVVMVDLGCVVALHQTLHGRLLATGVSMFGFDLSSCGHDEVSSRQEK
jgi:hypothetical protein